MPYIPSSTNIAGPVTQSSATIASHEQLEQERQSARPGFFGGLLGSTALAPIDFVDTVASSIPFSPFERISEEHTSELQSLMRISYAVFCLKKKIINTINTVNK